MKRALLPAALAVERGSRATVRATPSSVATPRGLAPGAHGFRIGEKGDCRSGDGMSAGGHWKS